MTTPIAAWRVTYTPGEWLVLSGPTTLMVMLPAPARLSSLVNVMWDDIVKARSVAAWLAVMGQHGLAEIPDFAAFIWDEAGLHGMARGQLSVTDADSGETVVSGSDVVTWREELLGTARHLRVGMQPVNEDEYLRLPLVVGAALASVIQVSTDPDARIQFPERGHEGILTSSSALTLATDTAAAAVADEDQSVDMVGLGDESDMEPLSESEPHVGVDDDIPLWTPPEDNDDETPAPAAALSPAVQPTFTTPIPPPAEGNVVVPQAFQMENDDDDGGTVFSSNLAATHKPASEAEAQRQVLAVACARGHANAPGSRGCRICSAPVDSTHPRLINRPALAGVHSNRGEFVDVVEGVVVGRAPETSKGPQGASVMRVPSPSSDISRSHLLVTPREWSVIVTDLNSTNGTTVMPVGEQAFVLAGGESVQVDLGTVLDLGDGVSLRIEPPRG